MMTEVVSTENGAVVSTWPSAKALMEDKTRRQVTMRAFFMRVGGGIRVF
jgi:hypothetical protein